LKEVFAITIGDWIVKKKVHICFHPTLQLELTYKIGIL